MKAIILAAFALILGIALSTSAFAQGRHDEKPHAMGNPAAAQESKVTRTATGGRTTRVLRRTEQEKPPRQRTAPKLMTIRAASKCGVPRLYIIRGEARSLNACRSAARLLRRRRR